MNLHIPVGSWVIPLAITLVVFFWSLYPRDERRQGDWDFTFWLPWAFRNIVALIVSLIAWLVWSLMR